MKKKNQGFTLAEIMIVLTVIGILSVILLPVAFNSTPDKNILKFKKGYNTLTSVIRELVSSDKYYQNGDLGMKSDGTWIVGAVSQASLYFCKTFADVIVVKHENCEYEGDTGVLGAVNIAITISGQWDSEVCRALTGSGYSYTVTNTTISNAKNALDTACISAGSLAYINKIVSTDDITYFETHPPTKFGSQGSKVTGGCDGAAGSLPRFFSPPDANPAYYRDQNGFDVNYKIFCMDIDGIGQGEDPFGFGIRADGKILTGTRADEWLGKEITDKD